LEQGVTRVNGAALATADSSASPSVRIVNFIAIEETGMVFFANSNSGKIQQIDVNPRASLCFYWPVLQEQAIVEGRVERAGNEASGAYWEKVPREKHFYKSIEKEAVNLVRYGGLKDAVTEQWSQSGFTAIDRPMDWHAFLIKPDQIEFWRSGWRRAKERIRYSKKMMNSGTKNYSLFELGRNVK
jgi:pyridoxamine 5'-phosphate oxidase